MDSEQNIDSESEFPIHPLLMDHIVENVLDLVDPDLLGHYCKVFRLVCKDWARIATKVYKTHRGQITFKKNFIGRVSDLFIRVMRTSANIPFEKFRFCADSYDNEHFDELLHVCGGAITTLELNLINPCGLRFPKSYPNLVLGRLKTLVFHVRIENSGYLQLEMSSLLDALLEASPNLETLDVKVFGGVPRSLENANYHSTITRRFGDVIANKPPKRIRHLKLKMTLTDEQLNLLTQKKLKIQTMDVYFQQSLFIKESMEEFLASVAPSIVRCKAIGNQFLMENLKFPVFPNLKHLVALGRAPGSIKYQKIFPSLDKLEICLWDDSSNSLSFNDNSFSSSLRHLHFPFTVTSPHVYIRMANCFPNLRKLTDITVDNPEALKNIFRYLGTLEVLDITLGHGFREMVSVDSVFTGIPADACVYLLRLKDFEQNMALNDWNHNESIRNLKELRSLSICTSPLKVASNVRLTDITVYYAFLHLENLVKLHLDFFPVTDSGLEKLQKTIFLTRPC